MRRVAAKHHSIFSSPSAEDVHFASSQGSRLHCNYCALYYTMILYSMPSRFQLLFLLTIVTCSAFTSVLKFPSNGRLGRPIFQSNTEATDVSSSQDEQRTPKPEVRCPDCDLCDGSGRLVASLTIDIFSYFFTDTLEKSL